MPGIMKSSYVHLALRNNTGKDIMVEILSSFLNDLQTNSIGPHSHRK
jgi:hypothetical protein